MVTVSASTLTAQVVSAPSAPLRVDTDWLLKNLDDVQIIDTRRGNSYALGHIPGARSIPLDELLMGDTRTEALTRLAYRAQKALSELGISPHNHVVFVGDNDGSAALGAVVYELAGAAQISTLIGGYSSWVTRPTAPISHQIPPATSIAQSNELLEQWTMVEPNLRHLATFEQLIDAVRKGTHITLDVRSQLEHEGIIGSPCCAARGAIPDSIHLEWTRLIHESGSSRSSEQIVALLHDLGVSRTTPVIVTCHAGHRAAIAARILRGAGLENVKVSLGSWHEWSQRSPRPLA